MTILTDAELDAFLTPTTIAVASPDRGIGRQLTYDPPALRVIVIHFGSEDPPDYIARVVSMLLTFAESWLLMPRYGSASQLGALTDDADAAALTFSATEREQLTAYVCTRDMSLGSVSVDIYLVSGDGNILITWDHHTEDEGLSVEMRDVRQSSALLADLNAFGVELEVFYTGS